MKPSRTWRQRLGLPPSAAERHAQDRDFLLSSLREEREARLEMQRLNAQTQAKLLESVAASSNVFSEYLKLVTSPGMPTVRVMTDEIEAALQRKQVDEFKRNRKGYQWELDTPEDLPTRPAPSALELSDLMDSLKKDLL